MRQTLQQYHDLYQTAPVGFVTLDKQGRITQLNDAAAHLIGFPASWLLHRPFLVFVAKDDIQVFLDLLMRGRQKPEQQTVELALLADNRHLPVQILLRSSMQDERLTYQVIVVDLTNTRKIQQELSDLLNNWHTLVKNAPDVIMTVSRNSRITFVNRPCWGCSLRALLGTRLTDYVSEHDRTKVETSISRAFTARQHSSCEVSGVNGDRDRWYSFNFGGIREEYATTTATTTVTIRDITEHKLTEESLRASREQLRDFAARLEAVREEERSRIAREIHDELGQALTILKMDLAWLQRRTAAKDGARQKVKSMIGYVDQTIDQVRRLVSELRPSILDEMGLPAAVEWQLSQFQERTGIRSIFEAGAEEFSLPPDVAAALFRVIQEGLTNVMRHAGARQVRVSLKASGSMLRIAITDNGKGVSRQQLNDLQSFGIVGMRERVHRLGGEFNIFSEPGRGTRLEIVAPLK